MTYTRPPALQDVSLLRARTPGHVIGPHAEAIVAAIAERHGVTIAELKSDARPRRLACPRQEAFHALYATGRYSLPTIGVYFGGRDHTTVIHGIRAHEARLRAEAEKAAA